MTDNTLLNAGSGGDTIATDDIGGVKHQQVKLQYGEDGSATDVSLSAPLPVRSIPEIAAFHAEPTLTHWNRFGSNPDVDMSIAEDVWSGGGLWLPTPNTSAESVDVVSTDVNDDGSPAGTGAQTVEIFGLDASWAEQSEVVTLNGTSNVASANTYMVVYRTLVKAVGSGATNAGDITVTGATSTFLYSHTPAGFGSSQQATHVVPDGKEGYLYDYYVGVSAGSGANVAFSLEVFDQTNYPHWSKVHRISIAGGAHEHHTFVAPLRFEGKTLIKIEAASDTNNTEVLGGFTLIVDG